MDRGRHVVEQVEEEGAPLGVRAAADIAERRVGEKIPHGNQRVPGF
ncbi:hypothetical protein [Streptomyces sp. NPDC058142]